MRARSSTPPSNCSKTSAQPSSLPAQQHRGKTVTVLRAIGKVLWRCEIAMVYARVVALPLLVGPAYCLVPLGFFALAILMLIDFTRIRSGRSYLFREEAPPA